VGDTDFTAPVLDRATKAFGTQHRRTRKSGGRVSGQGFRPRTARDREIRWAQYRLPGSAYQGGAIAGCVFADAHNFDKPGAGGSDLVWRVERDRRPAISR